MNLIEYLVADNFASMQNYAIRYSFFVYMVQYGMRNRLKSHAGLKRINVKIISVNNALRNLNLNRLMRWRSSIFRIDKIIDDCVLNENYDIRSVDYGAYSTKLLDALLPKYTYDGLTVFITNDPLEGDEFSVISGRNRILCSLYEIKHILERREIPIENHIISMLYSYALIYLAKGAECLSWKDEEYFAHDPVKKCVFDYRYDKKDVMYTSIKPILCDYCTEKLLATGISNETIQSVKSDLRRLRKDTYHTIIDFLKEHPILSIAISIISTILINLLCNLISSF